MSPAEAGTSTSTSTSDASVDTGSAAEGGPVLPTSFCESLTGVDIVLCDDFDKNDFDPRWTKKELALPRAEIAAAGYSAPDAFHLAVEPNPGRPSPDRLALVLDTTAVHGITTTFQVKPVKYPASSSNAFRVATIEQVPGDPTRDLSLILAETAPLSFEEQIERPGDDADFRNGTGSASPATGTWTQIEIDVDFDAPRAKVRVDGVEALAFSLSSGWSSGKTRVLLGNFYVKDTVGFEVFYDDVVVRTR